MFARILPDRLDNTYEGHWAGLVLCAFVVISRIAQSVILIVGGSRVVAGADGIRLDAYPTAAAQNLVAVYANAALSRLILMAIALVVLVRYRRAVPAMFAAGDPKSLPSVDLEVDLVHNNGRHTGRPSH